MAFVTAIIEVLGTIFTEYVPDLASAVVEMFSGLFWVAGTEGAGSLTILGQAFIAFIGIALVSSIFHIVYRIFRGRMKRRV